MINVDYPNLLSLFPQHIAPKRSESASFLIWYLENYYRLDTLDAVDSVCDQKGDKGVDGIFVNDNDLTITVFQSKISQSAASTVGDSTLREFAGTLKQFESADAITNLIATAGAANVASLSKRLDLVNKIASHELRGEFIANVDIDVNGTGFLQCSPHIKFVGKADLLRTYISDQRDVPVHKPVKFDVAGYGVGRYIVDADASAVIAPIRAMELVSMHGISDQSLYAYNVRGPLGKTQVNKDIVNSINDASRHKQFPLFHNGITVICKHVEVTPETIAVSDYYVVNGCQSLTALHDHKAKLTDGLRVLVKFIQMDPTSSLAAMVTRFSNNQNGVKARDFMANNPVQIRLQNEFKRDYGGQYWFEIKRGESSDGGMVLSNESIGLFLMAFDLKEPWATHRKYQVFEDKHADLFARKEVTADRIVMCQVVNEAIEEASAGIKNALCQRYILTRYFLLYCTRQVIDSDPLGPAILSAPQEFVRGKPKRDHFRKCVKNIVDDIVIDLNAEIDEFGEDFDYRDKLRDADWSKHLAKKVVGDYLKLVNRGRIRSFKDEWEHAQQSLIK